MSAESPERAPSAKAATTSTPLECQRRRHNVACEERLLRWELCHGFLGVYRGRSIYRKCACGRPTSCLTDAECRACKGMVRINQHFRCRMDGCTGPALQKMGMLCRACWVAEDPERAARVLKEWEAEKGFAGVFYSTYIVRKCACGKGIKSLDQSMCIPCTSREAKIASGFKPKRPPRPNRRPRNTCTTDGCAKGAHFQKGTLCERCYVQADPDARGCPRCKKNKQVKSRADRLCWDCVRADVREAEGHRRKLKVPVCALTDALFDTTDTEDLEDALGAHLGECVAVD